MNLFTTIEMYKSFIKLKKRDINNPETSSLLDEGTQRLQQINMLLEKTIILEASIGVAALLMIPNNEDNDTTRVELSVPEILKSKKALHIISDKTFGELLLEFTTTVESIYYFAWRFVKICHSENLGLRNFNPKGIREVRNKLIEHPNIDTDLTRNFNITHQRGYSLRTTMIEDFQSTEMKGKVIDKGLKVNIEEFISELEHLLNLRLGGK